jgi:hypothetical protein
MRILLLLILLQVSAGMQAQDAVPADSLAASVDSLQFSAATKYSPGDSLTPPAPMDYSSLPTLRNYASWTWSKDSMALMQYQHVGDVLNMHPFVHLADLGNFGQPYGILAYSASPMQASATVNGLPIDDLLTGMSASSLIAIEDAARITAYPQYQSFWYGSPGDVVAVDMTEKTWDAPRPITRLRHAEAANDYLFTDAMFTLNPTDHGNLKIAGTRMTIGGTAGTNAARFENSLSESWNLRAHYRDRISDILTTAFAVRYNDDITYLNGGVLGSYDSSSARYMYDKDGTSAFSDEAFSTITASIVNPTMYTHRQRYTATGELHLRWTADSSQVTRLRVHAISDVRRFRDALGEETDEEDIIPSFNLTDQWSTLRAQLDHETALSWARLTLRGHVARFALEKGGEALTEDGVESGARGRLDLLLGPVALSGFGALDYRLNQTAVSIGTGAELPLGAIAFWGGFSFSPRIRSLLATEYRPQLLVVSGDRTPDLDKVTVLEGGLRLFTRPLELDVRGFVRHEDLYLMLQTTPYQGDVAGRYTFLVSTLPDAATQTVTGASMTANLSIWRLRLDQQATYQRSESSTSILDIALSPELQYGASLYYRGNLIEGTLDLKAGASFFYSSEYTPLIYYPEAGIFTLPYDVSDGAGSYTDHMRLDLFLFATIKQRATIHVAFHNVLNTTYITSAFYPMYDRALRVGVDWIFFD